MNAVPDMMDDYHPPSPPKWKKQDRFDLERMSELDSKAKQVQVGITFEEIAGNLTNHLENDLEKVRALFTWFGNLDSESLPNTNDTDSNTPTEYLKLVFNRKGCWAKFFAQLCRAAKLQCVVVHGSGKGLRYEVGEQDVSDYRSSWNVVYVDDSWQIVHPMWAFITVMGYDSGKWIKIETEGKGTRSKGEVSKGYDKRRVCEDFFLPDPEEFIYKCMADKEEWQLLKKPWDLQTFCNVPYFQFSYFTSDYKLTSDHKAILYSVDGKCQMEFSEKKGTTGNLSYELFFNENQSEEKLPPEELPRFIFFETEGSKLRLLIRFRVIGIYKLSVISRSRLLEIRLEATEKSRNENWLPANPPIGYGYGHTAENMGIVEPSHRSGVVVTQRNRVEDIGFKMLRDMQIVPRLSHSTHETSSLDRYLSKTTKGSSVNIRVTMPNDQTDEEYALQVYAIAKQKQYNILNYILTTNKDDFEYLDETMKIKKKKEEDEIRRNLEEALAIGKLDPLKRSVSAFVSAGLKDTKGHLFQAETKIDILDKERQEKEHIEQVMIKLQSAMKRKNIKELKSAITEAECERDKKLHEMIKMAKDRVAELEREARVLDLRQAAESTSIHWTEKAIASYKKDRLRANNELFAAEENLLRLYEKEASDATSSKNIKRLEELRDLAKESVIADRLESSAVMEKAFKYVRQQNRLKDKHNTDMKLTGSTVNEIRNYKKPKQVTVDTMKTTFILLGEDPRRLVTWEDIQKHLNPSSAILRKIKGTNAKSLHHQQVAHALRLLEKHTFDDAREVSEGVAIFFKWCDDMIQAADISNSHRF